MGVFLGPAPTKGKGDVGLSTPPSLDRAESREALAEGFTHALPSPVSRRPAGPPRAMGSARVRGFVLSPRASMSHARLLAPLLAPARATSAPRSPPSPPPLVFLPLRRAWTTRGPADDEGGAVLRRGR